MRLMLPRMKASWRKYTSRRRKWTTSSAALLTSTAGNSARSRAASAGTLSSERALTRMSEARSGDASRASRCMTGSTVPTDGWFRAS